MFFFLSISDIAKSFIIFDVKPFDDETDLDAMEKAIRTIEVDGLLWGQCKCSEICFVWIIVHFHFLARQVLIAFGLKKLEIGCVIEDDKVEKVFYLVLFSLLLIYIFITGWNWFSRRKDWWIWRICSISWYCFLY